MASWPLTQDPGFSHSLLRVDCHTESIFHILSRSDETWRYSERSNLKSVQVTWPVTQDLGPNFKFINVSRVPHCICTLNLESITWKMCLQLQYLPQDENVWLLWPFEPWPRPGSNIHYCLHSDQMEHHVRFEADGVKLLICMGNTITCTHTHFTLYNRLVSFLYGSCS